MEKFIKPSGILELEKERVKILDIGFGLGYNVALAVYHLKNKGVREIIIYSFEKEFPEDFIILPEPYTSVHRKIIDTLPEGEFEGVYIKVFQGDARKNIKGIGEFYADAVFHDPFSPFKNPELWTYDFLKEIKRLINPYGYWVSYSGAHSVRKSLELLGFKVGGSRPVGRKRSGTVASLKEKVPPLPEDERKKLLTSPYSVPMRDPELNSDALTILINYRIDVSLKSLE